MKKNKNIIALVVCFFITVITYDLQSVRFYIENFSSNFYESYELEYYLYTLAGNSVYTVVGDGASEDMLERRQESTEILDKEENSNIFVKNNDNQYIYTNQLNFDLNTYINKVREYPYVIEINFRDDSMYLLKDDEKIKYETKNFGNLAFIKKEDVTTYIAIPDVDIISERPVTDNDMLHEKYNQYIDYRNEVILFLGSKVLAGIVLIGIAIVYLKNIKNIKQSRVAGSALSIIGTVVISNISVYGYGPNIMYIPINTITTFIICFFSLDLIRYIINNNSELRKNKQTIKYVIILISSISIHIIFSFIAKLTFYDHSLYLPPYMAIMVLTIPIFINIILFYFIFIKINRIQHIQRGISEIRKGNLNYKIDMKNDDLFNDIVEDVNAIGEAINISVEEKLKSERLKTELITNVSHDLKTPLTAIINYVSLMKKEDLKPEHVKDYVKVLDARSQRLKVLIDDLFEASKINSNNIDFKLEKTDINQLLTQSIVEMDNLIEDANLDFIINVPDEEVYVMVEGDKTWRIFENIISNIVKYSLKGTRVYIDMISDDNKVNITMKNISNHPLNFDANEITERCKRGDLSRNTEGSGLGLSIAKGFTEGQGGKLDIDIIGDMFVVNIEFNTI